MDSLIRAASGRARVFVSFDFDQDAGVARLMAGQLTGSRFAADDWSLKEAAPQRSWTEKAARHIKQSHLVLVVVGSSTCRAAGVAKEVAIAREADKPICQVIGYRDLVSPTRVANAGRLYRWTPSNLAGVLDDAYSRRAA
ncbi:MAG: TIR domain-containing protein [Solirubrobacteraceae bacterium MAG38_C4-C5]|nr:TIR domain-containing protein [Candidatus Siliceabacter maunaloa]